MARCATTTASPKPGKHPRPFNLHSPFASHPNLYKPQTGPGGKVCYYYSDPYHCILPTTNHHPNSSPQTHPSKQTGPDGKVCYYYSDPRTIYEKLGHAEVVQVALTPGEQAQQEAEFRWAARCAWEGAGVAEQRQLRARA